MMEFHQDIQKICPVDVTIESCQLGLVSYVRKKTGVSEIDKDGYDWLLGFFLNRGATNVYRRFVMDLYKTSLASALHRYVAIIGWNSFYLAALRLMATYRLMAESSKTCPDISAFDKEPLLSLRTDPYSGQQITVEKFGDNLLVLRSPAPIGKQAGRDKEPALVIECPFR